MQKPLFVSTFVLATSLIALDARSAEVSEITKDDYYQATYFHDALENPKISKLKNRAAQISAIASDLKVKPKKLEESIAKFESIGDAAEITKRAEAALKKAVEGTRLKGK